MLHDAQHARLTTLEDHDPEPRVVGLDTEVGGPLIEFASGEITSIGRGGALLQPSRSAVQSVYDRRHDR